MFSSEILASIGVTAAVAAALIGLWGVQTNRQRLKLEKAKIELERKVSGLKSATNLLMLGQSYQYKLDTDHFILSNEYLRSVLGPKDEIEQQSILYTKCLGRSDKCIVFLSGLGLDHRDFATHQSSYEDYDCIALTMYGFQPAGTAQISLTLDAHVKILAHTLNSLLREHKYSSIDLVGFSIGADMLSKLVRSGELSLNIRKLLLLDPNFGHETIFISKVIASMGEQKSPLGVAQELSNAPHYESLGEWLAIHRYLIEIFRKFGASRIEYLRDFADQIVSEFERVNYGEFLEKLNDCRESVDFVSILFSDSDLHRKYCSRLRDDFASETVSFSVVEGATHFDLRDRPDFIKVEIDSVVNIEILEDC